MTKIFFMLAYSRSRADRPVFGDVIANLSAEGFAVSIGVAQTTALRPEELRVEADLYVLKSQSSFWLNIAAILGAKGAQILNPYPACLDTINKIRTAARLSSSNVPTPRTWVSGDLAQIPGAGDAYPVIIKPNIGRGGTGIRIVRDRSELHPTEIADGMLVQELISAVEDEVKLYVVGESVFGIRKHAKTGNREPFAVDPVFENIALECRTALGLEICGLDVVVGPKGPVVVDVNYFPSFRGVPHASRVLADFIGDRARSVSQAGL